MPRLPTQTLPLLKPGSPQEQHMNAAGSILLKISRWTSVFVIVAAAMAAAQRDPTAYRAATPAGAEVVLLKPSGAVVTLLGLAECQEIAGAQHIDEGLNAKVVSANGAPLKRFPRDFSFRVTASLRKMLLEDPGTVLNTEEEPSQLLVRLRFRLKAYDGLQMRVIEPESSAMIGVPADIAYDERIYRVNFHLPSDEPLTERFVLEVLEPRGGRLARLHFSLL
jgi:hypothetical protein